MNAAKGKYLKFLFDDDVLHPFCVQYMVEALLNSAGQQTKLVFSPRGTIDFNGRHTGTLNPLRIRKDTVLQGTELIRYMSLNLQNPIGEFTSVLFRAEDLANDASNYELFTLRGTPWLGLGDVALFMYLCSNGNAIALSQVLSYFRVHSGSNSNPAYNSEWRYAVTDWSLAVDFAISNGVLQRIERFRARRRLLSFLQGFGKASAVLSPHMDEEIEKVLEHAEGSLERLFFDWKRGGVPLVRGRFPFAQ